MKEENKIDFLIREMPMEVHKALRVLAAEKEVSMQVLVRGFLDKATKEKRKELKEGK